MVNLTWPGAAFRYGLCSPHIKVDGHLMARGWGAHTVALPPGAAQVAVHVPYMGFQVGKAQFTVEPDGPERLEYRPPYLVTARGDLGVTARSRGAGAVAALVLAVLLLPAAWVAYVAWEVNHQLTATLVAGSATTETAVSTPASTSAAALAAAANAGAGGHGLVLQVQAPGTGLVPGDLSSVTALLERRLALGHISGATFDTEGSDIIVVHLPTAPDQATVDLLGPEFVKVVEDGGC